MKTHTIRRRRYDIVRDEVIQGYADVSTPRGERERYEIYVAGDQRGRAEMHAVIEEFSHAWFDHARHDWSTLGPFSKELARFMWRWGYRRQK